MRDFTNRLIGENSPYLLQHAHNPVDWYPWGSEAFEKAVAEDKPVLVSIGYAACHWCHVMEKESFEDAAVAQFMNEHFVNIKIDREERPDLDHIYMDALQAMNGQGGWPLNVFLTPSKQPFYGGTYFPPRPVYNRPSWMQVLEGVHQAYREKKEDIHAQAEQLTQHLQQMNAFGLQQRHELPSPAVIFSKEKIDLMAANILQQADKEEGGFGQAPRFPQTFSIRYLLHHFQKTGDEESLQQACLSLDKMMYGGIYDQIGGGFARYSTDAEWLVPHFEKMLYDNALLIQVYAQAYSITGDIRYERIIRETIHFVNEVLRAPDGGFYSALDADSEGEEGKFYVWDFHEFFEVLGEDAGMWMEYFGVTERGNWEDKNILRITEPDASFAGLYELSLPEFYQQLDQVKSKLKAYRSKRIAPALDDKQLLGWNALMNTALATAAAALGDEDLLLEAVAHASWMQRTFYKDGEWWHSFKEGTLKIPAFLDDHAFLLQSWLMMQEITGDNSYLKLAAELTEQVQQQFLEAATGLFFYTSEDQEDVIVRKKEVYDGATPSGNAVMSECLYQLGILLNRADWKEQAYVNAMLMHQVANRYPTSFGVWANLIQGICFGFEEIAIVGGNFAELRKQVLRVGIPYRVLQSAPHADEQYPLLAEKPETPAAQIFLCREYMCQVPVNEVSSMLKQMVLHKRK